jgi:Leucine rich repeat variant
LGSLLIAYRSFFMTTSMTDLDLVLSESTSPADLMRLASSRDAAVRRAVASHPNAPESVLERLAALEPEAFLANPALSFLRFLNPAFFEDLPSFARHALLASTACPEVWLERAGLDELSALAALRNSNLTNALLRSWLGQVSSAVDDAIQHHVAFCETADGIQIPSLGIDLELFKDVLVSGIALDADTLARLADEYDSDLRTLIAANPHCDGALLQRLVFDDDEVVRTAARNNANLPDSVGDWARRAERGHSTAREREQLFNISSYARLLVAKHEKLSLALLRRLAKDDDWLVRQAVAAHNKAPPEVLKKLAKDSDRDVREAAASHPGTPPESLEQLLTDSTEAIRIKAQGNANAPRVTVELLHRLEKRDPNLRDIARLPAWMNKLVAAHPNAPEDLLERLAQDDDIGVVCAVAGNSSTPQKVLERLCRHGQSEVLMAVVRNPRLSVAGLKRLAASHDQNLREVVAMHLHLPQALLEQLGQDAHWEVRRAVVQHPRCPTHLLERLSADADADVAFSAVLHRRANSACAMSALGVEMRLPEALSKIRAHDLSLESGWLEFVARRGNDAAKRLMASHPNTSLAVLEWLATHANWQVRLQVAQNPMANEMLLLRLANDPDSDVRQAVASHQNTPMQAFEQLALDSHVGVRRALLMRSPPLLLDALAWDDDSELRREARVSQATLELRGRLERGEALNDAEIARLERVSTPWVLGLLASNASVKNLEFFVTHSDSSIREAALQNPNVGLADFERLVDDTESAVRCRVALHAKTPPELLIRLLRDNDLNVRRAALSNANLEPSIRARAQRLILDESLRSSTLNRIVALERTDRVFELRKRKNANSLEWRERLAVVKNPSTPFDVLERLAQDANRLVRLEAQTRLGAS